MDELLTPSGRRRSPTARHELQLLEDGVLTNSDVKIVDTYRQPSHVTSIHERLRQIYSSHSSNPKPARFGGDRAKVRELSEGEPERRHIESSSGSESKKRRKKRIKKSKKSKSLGLSLSAVGEVARQIDPKTGVGAYAREPSSLMSLTKPNTESFLGVSEDCVGDWEMKTDVFVKLGSRETQSARYLAKMSGRGSGDDWPTGLETESIHTVAWHEFLNHSPGWYKFLILMFLVVNIPMAFVSQEAAGWAIVCEFVFTLAMSTRCYPLGPAGLLIIESCAIGLMDPDRIFTEIQTHLDVFLLLIYMVAATHFMKPMLLWIFSSVILRIEHKSVVCLIFLLSSVILSAFLDSLTLMAVVIHTAEGLYDLYVKMFLSEYGGTSAMQGLGFGVGIQESIATDTDLVRQEEDRGNFSLFLRDLVMHSIIGVTLGGTLTELGEPQNLIVSETADWGFSEYFLRMAPITIPALVGGILTMFLLEMSGSLGYGTKLPDTVRQSLYVAVDRASTKTLRHKYKIGVQVLILLFICVALGLQLASVGLIGLTAVILLISLNGITDETMLGKAFQDSLPFTGLLVLILAVVSMVNELELFQPIFAGIFQTTGLNAQMALFFVVAGALTLISDNVFIAAIFVTELQKSFTAGLIDQEKFDFFTVCANSGTNILSVGTPNGQIAFLFLLTSSLAGKINLNYLRMIIMTFPYFVIMGTAGAVSSYFALQPITQRMVDNLLILNGT